MKTILIIITLIIATTGWTQNVTQPITDTSMVVGVVKEDCLGKILDYCSVSTDKEFKKGTTVIVCGIQECKKNYSNVIIINKDVVQYYEICRNKQTYYIERDKLATMPNVYEEIALLSSDHADTFKKNAQNTAELIYKSELRKALNFLSACKPKGLVITKWSLYDVSEYTEGTGLRISVYNPTQKTIKYLWITVTGFNPV